MLHLPSDAGDVKFLEWAEEEDPYSKAISILPNQDLRTIFVDNSIRKFVVDGLQRADPKAKVESAPFEINQMRERKSEAELEILRCVNEVWCAFHITPCSLVTPSQSKSFVQLIFTCAPVTSRPLCLLYEKFTRSSTLEFKNLKLSA